MLPEPDCREMLLPSLPVETIAAEGAAGRDQATPVDLLLLHGWGLHSEFFRPWASLLAPQCRIHLIDLPGHGHSPAVEPYTLDAMAAAVANAMQAVAPTYAVAGWSLGGAVALRLAIDFPDAVSHVVTLASSPRFLRADDWQHATTPHALELLRAGLARDYTGTLAQFFELNMAGKFRDHADALAALAVKRPAVRPEVLAPGVALTSGVDLRDEVAAIRAEGYQPRAIYENNPVLKRVLDAVAAGDFSPTNEPTRFQQIFDVLVNWGDHYLLLADFESYVATQHQVDELFKDPYAWAKKAILNVAGMGPFSSDRTIAQYADEIWHTKPVSLA